MRDCDNNRKNYKDMRVGIVTQPLEMNYGGIIQNWALQQVLKQLGHEPITIDAYQRFSTPHYIFNYMRAKLMRACGKKYPMPRRYHGATRNDTMGRFIEQHINKTEVMWHYKRGVVKRYGLDAIVVGSDQVWRAIYSHGHIEDHYLRFTEGLPLKRVAYAASFGVNKWEYTPEQTAACAKLAQQMDAISVREVSGVDLCREHLGVEAQCVLDPTLLLDASEYSELIDRDWDSSEPYLAVYCLDHNQAKEKFFNQFAADRGLKVRYFSAGWKAELSIQQWLAIFSNASFVVTDSFHGTVFSILFGKEFYNLCSPWRGLERVASLLKALGLEQRQLSDERPVEPDKTDIDWQDVNARLDVLRKQSIDFLKGALES